MAPQKKCYSQDTSTRPQDVRPQLNKDKSPPRTHKPKETATKAKVAGKAVDDPLSELQPSKPSPNTRKPAHVRAKKAADKGQIAKEATKKAKVGVEANFHGEADAAAKSKVNAKVEVAPIPEVNTKTEVIANAKADSEVEATRKAVVSTKVETIANAKINIVVDDSANTKNDVKTVEETAPKADSGEVRFRPELGPLKLISSVDWYTDCGTAPGWNSWEVRGESSPPPPSPPRPKRSYRPFYKPSSRRKSKKAKATAQQGGGLGDEHDAKEIVDEASVIA